MTNLHENCYQCNDCCLKNQAKDMEIVRLKKALDFIEDYLAQPIDRIIDPIPVASYGIIRNLILTTIKGAKE